MKKYIIPLFILISFTSMKCTKESAPEQLPLISSEGANTLGFILNGAIWLPHSNFNYPKVKTDYFISHDSKNPILSIIAYNRLQGSKSSLNMALSNVKDTGFFKLYKYKNLAMYYDNGSTIYRPNDTNGYIHIMRYDTISKIISGTFSFTAVPDTSLHLTNKFNISEGRFDLRYPTSYY